MEPVEPVEPAKTSGTDALAWVVVTVLAGIVILVVVTLAYSTVNVPFSVESHKTEYSHNLPSSGQ